MNPNSAFVSAPATPQTPRRPRRPLLCGRVHYGTRLSAPRTACSAGGHVPNRAARPSRSVSGGRVHGVGQCRNADCDRGAFAPKRAALTAGHLAPRTRVDCWPAGDSGCRSRPLTRRAAAATGDVRRWPSDAGTADRRCWSRWSRPNAAAWCPCDGTDAARTCWICGNAGWTAALRSWWTDAAGGASRQVPTGRLWQSRRRRRSAAVWLDWVRIRCARRDVESRWVIWAGFRVWSCAVCCGWQNKWRTIWCYEQKVGNIIKM